MFHNQPRDVTDSQYRFIISLESHMMKDDEDEMINYGNSLVVFEGPVLPCESTGETVRENAQGLVVDTSFMRGILRYYEFEDSEVYFSTVKVVSKKILMMNDINAMI